MEETYTEGQLGTQGHRPKMFHDLLYHIILHEPGIVWSLICQREMWRTTNSKGNSNPLVPEPCRLSRCAARCFAAADSLKKGAHP